ncbi:MAG: AraC family transcriptional regulator [Eubacterium sp.]|jgi:AraC-like DNA-binding protein|uniref:DNA-binding domain-containing protein, AraC-type n=1 Tax=Eubacterium cellulosolvens (strain ATCC 43171 / JCM 9499 / 6) TaxID=633697 RepID=I5ARD1_EUBC6|nr:helix-turn-helix domain-containing protein [[Eubacterium] cellulosolvens]MCR4652564.1 AraC family transcriptional regulator [Eubacterium sp.]
MEFANKELLDRLLEQKEEKIYHKDYDSEILFYQLVSSGQVGELHHTYFSLKQTGLGKLSNDPVRNYRYHFVICAALISRFCIEAGMNVEIAYTLSDMYIQKADQTSREQDLYHLHRQMVFDYASNMNIIKRERNVHSTRINKAIDYINNHLHDNITVSDISTHLSMNNSYLCTLFRKETGMTVHAFIEKNRIDLAKSYLCYTDYSFSEIADILCFSSQSHFISVFKKHTAMTPKEYQKENYRKAF